MAACSALNITEANTLGETDNPCYGRDPSHGLNGNAARDGVNCDTNPNGCTPYPHTDIALQGYTDMRAYYYTGYSVSYTHLRAHETVLDLVCRLLLEKKKNT